MRIQDWLTLAALIAGPAAAVFISLFIEGKRRKAASRERVVRMLLATRHMPAHPEYNMAVNLIPVEFNDHPPVLSAWRRYLDLVRESTAHVDHEKRLQAAQSTMILECMRSAGLTLSESDIQTLAYVSQGFVDRDMIYIQSLQAMTQIANCLKRQNELTECLLQAPQLKKAS